MKIIGLTGPTGSGKTTVSAVAAELGCVTVDCDKVARKVTESGEVLRKLTLHFGEDIIKENLLDRRRLAEKAFVSKESKAKLESILFPEILRLIEAEIKRAAENNAEAVILDAPTLIESGLDKRCDGIIAVLCDRNVRKERIILRDGLSDRDAEIRLNAGKPDEFYKKATNNILSGSDSLEIFKANAENMLKSLIKG